MSFNHCIALINGSSEMVALTTALLIVGVFLIVAASRKGSRTLKRRPRRLDSFTAKMSPEITLKTIVGFAQQSGYKIEFLDEIQKCLVLSDTPSLTSFGFFYPIYLTALSEIETLIEVGVKSKLWQI